MPNSNEFQEAVTSPNFELDVLADQIKVLIMHQSNRDARMMEQVELQLGFFERIQSRLDEFDRRLQFHLDNGLPDARGTDSKTTRLEDSSAQSWQSQREQMMQTLMSDGENEPSPVLSTVQPIQAETESHVEEIDKQVDEIAHLLLATPEQVKDIDTLKEQLKAAIREMELECSIERAKLSQERQRIEEKEAELSHLAKNLSRQNASHKRTIKKATEGSMLTRLKGFLGHTKQVAE